MKRFRLTEEGRDPKPESGSPNEAAVGGRDCRCVMVRRKEANVVGRCWNQKSGGGPATRREREREGVGRILEY